MTVSIHDMLDVTCKKTFRELAKVPRPQTPLMAINSVIIVGGLLNRYNQDEVLDYDRMALAYFMTELAKISVVLSDCPEIKLCSDQNGDDFIRDEPYADLIISAFINKFGCAREAQSIGMLESPLLNKGHTWTGAFEKANPKFIGMNTNDKDCVGNADIPSGYNLISQSLHEDGGYYLYYRADLRHILQ